MTARAIPHPDGAVTSATTPAPLPMYGATAWMRDVAAAGEDVLLLAGVVLCIPAVILAIGIPIALFLQLLLWIGRLI